MNRAETITIVVVMPAVIGILVILGTFDPPPYAVMIGTIALAALAALAYVELWVNRRRPGRDR